ncbi:MAG: NADH:flavin oxidoreductase/NADH oxidase family protein [SAR86 cluster bacterium]|uniref:NADH:flavin oxidoreductase/NADH oxidase family protein n=1 Tax=SAR86 cluster bacterium TaxID=2030880 RepID=A0A937M2S2_9GAMM|nr:NADH:flavin oxidoreductase/NADH oxidase family protein [SAR86 cluster bacterium]
MTIGSNFTLPCGVTLKNRLCKAAMTEGIADSNNFATQRHINLYKKWASGGAGILLSGNVQVDKRYLEGPGNVAIEKETYLDQIDNLRKWAEVGTRNNTQFWMQISHAGRQTPGAINPNPLSPSSIQLKIPGANYGTPTPMSVDDIEDVIQRFIFVAKIAKETGFTGIQLHAAHGYLLSQFLSPDINLRDDEWGGSITNRSRLMLRIIEGCRAELGNNFPIAVKLNSADFQKGGFSNSDSIKVAKLLDDAGVDVIEISGGTYEQPRLLGLDDVSVNKERSEERKPSTIAREAYFLNYAEKIQKAIKTPLMVTGGFRTSVAMNAALNAKACDLIGVGRPLCAQPLILNDLLAGSIQELPSYEKTLQIGRWWLSPHSPFLIIQALNAFSQQAWFYIQIKRMGDNLAPNLKLPIFKAYKENKKLEKVMIKELS